MGVFSACFLPPFGLLRKQEKNFSLMLPSAILVCKYKRTLKGCNCLAHFNQSSYGIKGAVSSALKLFRKNEETERGRNGGLTNI